MCKVYDLPDLRFSSGYICLFREIVNGLVFIVVNSHLYWDPRYDYLKYAQTMLMLTDADKVCNEAR